MPSIVTACENRINQLEREKIAVIEKLANCCKPQRGFEESFRTALQFLENPWQLWNSDRIEDKRAALKLAFARKLTYVRNCGFRAATPALPFDALSNLSSENSSKLFEVLGKWNALLESNTSRRNHTSKEELF